MKFHPVPIVLFLLLSGCTARTEEFRVLTETAAPASHIDWLGHDSRLLGEGALRLGERLPITSLVDDRMKPESLGGAGKVRIISVVPSLDTEVCDRQTHLLSETKELDDSVERVTISRDLPYAQGRFAEKSKLGNVRYLSDYRGGEFGKKMGLVIERNGLLARAVIVLDRQGVVRHLQVTPYIYALPDMAKAIGVAKELSRLN